jgi:SAM-dependent methyltransferase
MPVIETPHFLVSGGHIRPRFPGKAVNNELTDHIAAELGPLGLVPDAAAFERIFVATVLAGHPDPRQAWAAFYAGTLRPLRRPDAAGTGSVTAFARIYSHAQALIRGRTVLDVGCCFGFFPVLAAERDPDLRVIGMDLLPAAAVLAGRISCSQGNRARFAAADARALPLGRQTVDTVLAIHLLEHLPAEEPALAVGQFLRVARYRVVIAVPLEERPDPAFGHLQAFDLPSLARLGDVPGWSPDVHAADGGWLVLDRVMSAGGVPGDGPRPARSGRETLS